MNRVLILPALALALVLAFACGGGGEPAVSLTLTADLSQVPAGVSTDEALDRAAGVLRQRAQLYGITEPEIALGGDTITVSLKGIGEADALQLITLRGTLEFKREQVTTDGLVVCKTLQGEQFGVLPQAVNPDPASRSLARCISLDKLGEPVWVNAEVDAEDGTVTPLTQEHVEPGSWQAREDGTTLAMRFTPAGSDLVEAITRVLSGYHLGIFVDGELVGAPRIQRAITDGTAAVSGFPAGRATTLAAVLNAPVLPIPLSRSP